MGTFYISENGRVCRFRYLPRYCNAHKISLHYTCSRPVESPFDSPTESCGRHPVCCFSKSAAFLLSGKFSRCPKFDCWHETHKKACIETASGQQGTKETDTPVGAPAWPGMFTIYMAHLAPLITQASAATVFSEGALPFCPQLRMRTGCGRYGSAIIQITAGCDNGAPEHCLFAIITRVLQRLVVFCKIILSNIYPCLANRQTSAVFSHK